MERRQGVSPGRIRHETETAHFCVGRVAGSSIADQPLSASRGHESNVCFRQAPPQTGLSQSHPLQTFKLNHLPAALDVDPYQDGSTAAGMSLIWRAAARATPRAIPTTLAAGSVGSQGGRYHFSRGAGEAAMRNTAGQRAARTNLLPSSGQCSIFVPAP